MRFFIAAITLILLSACSSNSKPASPLAKFEKGNQHLKNTCKEGLGSAGSCHALAKKYENPPYGLMPDFFNAGRYYQYAIYGYKKECIQDNYGFACLQLGNLYEKGKGGLPTDKTQAYKYHKKACDNPSMKRNKFCQGINSYYRDYLNKQSKQRRQEEIRKNPCALNWAQYYSAKAQCQIDIKYGQTNNYSVCYKKELRKKLSKQGCTNI